MAASAALVCAAAAGGGGFGGGGRGGGFGGGGRGGGGRGGGGRRSDMRLKHDIVLLGRLDDGLGYYRFVYNGGHTAYVGVMAQEVRTVEAVPPHRMRRREKPSPPKNLAQQRVIDRDRRWVVAMKSASNSVT